MAQNILSNIGSVSFHFFRKRPLAIVKNDDGDARFTAAEITQLGNLNLQALQNITTGIFELGRPYTPAGALPLAGLGGVCPEIGPSSQLSKPNNCLDCVKKNFLDCVFNHGLPQRQFTYRTLLGAGNPTGVKVQIGNNDIYIDCPGWRNFPELDNIRQQVEQVENLRDNPWIADCHFHVFLPDLRTNVRVGQSNKVELTLRFRRDGEKIQLKKMRERQKIEEEDTGSGAVKGKGRFDFIDEDKTYVSRDKRKQNQPRRGNRPRRGNNPRWGGRKKPRKNKSRKSMKKKSRKSRKSRKSMKKKSRKSRKLMKKN